MADLVFHLTEVAASHDVAGQSVDIDPLGEKTLAVLRDVELEPANEVEGATRGEVIFVDFEVVVEELPGFGAGE